MVMTGASRWSKARCDTWLAMKSPTDDCGKPSSTTTSRLVLPTERDDRVEVHRPDRPEIDDLGVDAEAAQFSASSPSALGRADAPGEQCHVLALLVDPRLADRQHEIVELRHVEMLAVEDLVLEEDDRVQIADRRLEQALGVGRRIGLDDPQARDVAVPGARSPGCAGRRRGPPRRWGRGRRSARPSGRRTYRASSPPN